MSGEHASDVTDWDDLVWRSDAVERVLALREEVLPTLPTESLPLDRATGRVLAEPIDAEADAPPASSATMDGFALRAGDEYPLQVRPGEVFPEDQPPDLAPGEAVRVATGAPVPETASAVVKREDTALDDEDRLTGPAVEPGTYVYERGSNWAAGERLFEAGERLSPKDAILLGDLGLDEIAVRRRLSVAVAATGTEIHEGVSRDLDSAMLLGLVRAWGHDADYVGSAPDQYERVRDLIDDAGAEHDVVMTTGGTSVGHKDHVIRALDELGEVLFHRVRLRPGKPIAVARLPDHDAVAFAIPGKPVGAHTVTTLVAGPFFTGETAAGDGTDATVSATLARDVGLGPEGFEYVVPVTLERDGGGDEDGRPTAMPLGHEDSPLSVYSDTFDPSVLSSSTRATRADGVVITTEDLAAGKEVGVVPYELLE